LSVPVQLDRPLLILAATIILVGVRIGHTIYHLLGQLRAKSCPQNAGQVTVWTIQIFIECVPLIGAVSNATKRLLLAVLLMGENWHPEYVPTREDKRLENPHTFIHFSFLKLITYCYECGI